ncbi:hypothetical protein N7836_004251 [Vibrio vulnificus]|nr:hypothetical protein [Vibrio vulnificus]HCH6293809.1 hypothetical protein [Vibrio parahaemolyticus]
MSCDHAELKEVMDNIGEFQGGQQRHICAGCAFYLGVFHSEKGAPYNPGTVNTLENNQGGDGRHKNAYDAYHLGYYGNFRTL